MIRCRSLLFVPGNRIEDYIQKAVASGPDILCLDAEDSVPESEARAATDAIIATLRINPFPKDMTVAVRLRSPEQAGVFYEAFSEGRTPTFVIPKATLVACHELLTQHRGATLLPIIETLEGLNMVEGIAMYPRVAGLLYGPQDLAADISRPAWDGDHLPESWGERILFAAKLHRRVAITGDVSGGVYEYEKGWDGVVCLNPEAVAVANDVFKPYSGDVRKARTYLGLEQEVGGRPAKADGNVICGAPVYAQARRVLALHRFYGGEE